MSLFQRERRTDCSIELTRNRDGGYQWTVKSYHEPGYENAALDRIASVDQQLREQYLCPQPSQEQIEAKLRESVAAVLAEASSENGR